MTDHIVEEGPQLETLRPVRERRRLVLDDSPRSKEKAIEFWAETLVHPVSKESEQGTNMLVE